MSTSPPKYRLPFEAPIAEMEARLAELEIRYTPRTGRSRTPAASRPSPSRSAACARARRASIRTIYANLDPWETVLVSRCDGRPQTRDYLELVFDRFVELHGDRAIGDDKAIVTGLAHLDERR